MKFAIFSDIHGNLQALETIMEDIKKCKYDKVICLGDVIALGPNSKECLDLIINNNVEMVLGNHELYYLKGTEIDSKIEKEEINHQKWVKSTLNKRHTEFLSHCPMILEEKLGNDKIAFQHFFMDSSKKEYPFEDIESIKGDSIAGKIKQIEAKYIFIGHQHSAFEFCKGNKKIVDVGSSGCVKGNETFYTILTIDKGKVNIEKRVLKYDREKFVKTLNECTYPEKSIISKVFFGVN